MSEGNGPLAMDTDDDDEQQPDRARKRPRRTDTFANFSSSKLLSWDEVKDLPKASMKRESNEWRSYYHHWQAHVEAALLVSEDDADEKRTYGERVDSLLKLDLEGIHKRSEGEAIVRRWHACLTAPEDTTAMCLQLAQEVFENCGSESEWFSRWKDLTEGLVSLGTFMQRVGMKTVSGLGKTEDLWTAMQQSLDKMFVLFITNQPSDTMFDVGHIHNTLRRMHKAKQSAGFGSRRREERLSSGSIEDDERKPKDFLKLLHHVLDFCDEHKLIREDGRIKQPIFNQAGQFTKAYRDFGENGEIEELIGAACTDNEYWNLLNSHGNLHDQLEKRLKKVRSHRLPEGKKMRHWQAFQDGMFDAKIIRFIPIESVAFRRLPRDKMACAYHDLPFNDQDIEWHLRNGGDRDFLLIPEPIQMIQKTQNWEEDELIHIYAEAGAIFHGKRRTRIDLMGRHDAADQEDEKQKWDHPFQQHMTVHLGPGGCGKTTLLKIFSLWFHYSDITQFKTKDEDVFGFERLPKTLACFGYDIGKNWRIEPHFLFTLIDGGWLKVSRKFKEYMMYYAEQYIMIAMNDYLAMPDPGGALTRRCLLHWWPKLPLESNTNLVTLAEKWVSYTMKKCALALRYLRDKVYKGKLAKIEHPGFPESMRENIREMRQQVTPLLAFFESGEVIIGKPDEGLYLDCDSLQQVFKGWCKRSGLFSRAKIGKTSMAHILARFNMKLIYQRMPDYVSNNTAIDIPQLATGGKSKSSYRTIDPAPPAKTPEKAPEAKLPTKRFESRLCTWLLGCTLRGLENQCRIGAAQYKAETAKTAAPVAAAGVAIIPT